MLLDDRKIIIPYEPWYYFVWALHFLKLFLESMKLINSINVIEKSGLLDIYSRDIFFFSTYNNLTKCKLLEILYLSKTLHFVNFAYIDISNNYTNQIKRYIFLLVYAEDSLELTFLLCDTTLLKYLKSPHNNIANI